MEKIRANLKKSDYYQLQRLGHSKPAKGVVSEDLGHTEFKTSSATNGPKPCKRIQANLVDHDERGDNTTSEDISYGSYPLMLPTAYKTRAPKKLLAESNVTPTSSRCRVKPHPNFRGAERPTKEENEAKSFPSKPSNHFNSFVNDSSMPPSNQLALQRPKKSLSCKNSQGASPLEELNPNRAKRPKTSKGKRELEPFPMQDDCHASTFELKCCSFERVRRDPAPFPLATTSPSRSPCKHLQPGLSAEVLRKLSDSHGKENTAGVWQRFPLDSPSTDSLQCALSDEDDEDDDELALTDNDPHAILTYGGPRPFPMAMTQCLPESTHQASGSKRSAISYNIQRVNKRSRPSPKSNTFDIFSLLSIEGDSHVDPGSLCPYCDEPWPTSPSPTLLSLLECTKRKSYTDPRPGNALGLKAPLAVFIELCQRHRFEMTHLPLALERGWPTHLDFASLPNRIKGFRERLRQFIDHPNMSQFWREVKDDVKEVGRMRVVSVSGQYATFERTQPGYYGEQGSIIIHQTLYSIFPPDDIPLTSVDPLTPDQFVTRVLVPETAVLLIQDDMCLQTKEEALRVLDESKKYGVAMFPEQAQGEEAAEVGEQLARERANERRKLLEERGEADVDVRREVARERRLARKAKAKDKDQPAAKGKWIAKEYESDADPRGKKGDPRKGMRKVKLASDSNKSIIKAKPMQSKERGGVLILNGPGQLTPRSLKGQIRELSTVSWRSKRSPSTSPDTRSIKPTSRSPLFYKPSRRPISSPPELSTEEIHQDSEWVFDLRNVSPSSDHKNVDFDEILARYKGDPKALEGESDSDVVAVNDDSTPKPQPQRHRIVQRSISSDSEATSQKITPNLKVLLNEKVKKRRDEAVGVALGQTKRKKKAAAKDN